MKSCKILIALALIGALGGCKLGAIFMPEPKTAAKYKFTKGKKVAVLIDDYMSPAVNPGMKPALAQKIAAALLEGEALRPGDLIAAEAVDQTAKDGPGGKKLSIQHIGKEVGADLVVYVNITDFSLQSDPDNPLIFPKAKAYVKVVEVTTGERLWPIDLAGEPLETSGRMEGDLASDSADNSKWSDQLTDQLAVEVAMLFFDHPEKS